MRIVLIFLGVFLAGAAGTTLAEKQKATKAAKLPKRQIDTTKIDWLSYDKAVAYGKAEKKHLFIDFTATWCGWCKKMDATTFQDPAVIKAVNAHFVPTKVWGDQDSILNIDGFQISMKELTKSHYKVSGYPCFYFLAPDDKKVGPLPGYRQSADLLQALEFVRTYRYDTTRTKSNEQKTQQ